MKLITLFMLCFSASIYAQNNYFFLDRYLNPSILNDLNTPTYYLNNTTLNQEIGLYERELGYVFRIKNNVYKTSLYQYGYNKFQETSFKISTAKKLSKSIELGVRLSYNYLNIYELENLSTVSFDLGFGIRRKRYILRLLLENPLNASYIENDLESQFIISSMYLWTNNLTSEIRFEESLQSGLNLLHRIKYCYKTRVSLLLSQRVKPMEYGYGLGYKLKNFEFYSQYIKYSYTNALGICIVYTPKK